MNPDFLTLADRRLAYQRRIGGSDKPGLIFLGGYASDMTGTKASFLGDFCAQRDISFLRFDYRGHGASAGVFKDCTIGDWLDDTLTVFDALTEGPQIVVGSSMGGWLALLLAIKRRPRIHALIGIAAAPDFTEALMWEQFSPAQREKLKRDGFITDETAPPHDSNTVTWRLIEEARAHLVLQSPVDIHCPVRLLQGMRDAEVPWSYPQKIAAVLTGDDVRITLVKDGDHRLSRAQDLTLLRQTVEAFLT